MAERFEVVDEDGEVREVEVVDEDPDAWRFDDDAVEAVRIGADGEPTDSTGIVGTSSFAQRLKAQPTNGWFPRGRVEVRGAGDRFGGDA